MASPLSSWVVDVVCWVRAGWPHDYLPPLIALVGFLWGIYTYGASKRRERFKLGIDLILKLGAKFDSDVMLKHRATAARTLLDGQLSNSLAINAVLDFFEEVGFLLRRGAIDAEAAYTFFSYWLEAYFLATVAYRAEGASPLVWEDFESLCTTVERYDDWELSSWRWRWAHHLAWHVWRKRSQRNRWGAADSQVTRVLQEECGLVPRTEPGWVQRLRARRAARHM